MAQTKESEIRYLKSCLSDDLEDDDEKENIKAFIDALESGLLDEHEGRLAIFLNGVIVGATFESVSSFQSFKPLTDNNSYWLYTIPGGSCEFATAYQTHCLPIHTIPAIVFGFPFNFLKMVNQLVNDMTLKLTQVLRIPYVPLLWRNLKRLLNHSRRFSSSRKCCGRITELCKYYR
jgi:hypothetical protein